MASSNLSEVRVSDNWCVYFPQETANTRVWRTQGQVTHAAHDTFLQPLFLFGCDEAHFKGGMLSQQGRKILILQLLKNPRVSLPGKITCLSPSLLACPRAYVSLLLSLQFMPTCAAPRVPRRPVLTSPYSSRSRPLSLEGVLCPVHSNNSLHAPSDSQFWGRPPGGA